jgi:hypothetical protein
MDARDTFCGEATERKVWSFSRKAEALAWMEAHSAGTDSRVSRLRQRSATSGRARLRRARSGRG